jgi:hypothetical protein
MFGVKPLSPGAANHGGTHGLHPKGLLRISLPCLRLYQLDISPACILTRVHSGPEPSKKGAKLFYMMVSTVTKININA